MNSKMLFMAFAMLLTLAAHTSTAFAEVNLEDVNLKRADLNRANEEQMEAQANVRGAACETGTCYKDSHPKYGFEPEVLIEPSGTAGAPVKTKDGAITK